MNSPNIARLQRQRGAAALEYILISTFAVALSIASLAILTKMVKDELAHISERLGITLDSSPLDILGDSP